VDIHAGEWKEMKYVNNFEVTKFPVCAPMWGSEQNLKKAVEVKRLRVIFRVNKFTGSQGATLHNRSKGLVFPF
jgi:hypothetical protein